MQGSRKDAKGVAVALNPSGCIGIYDLKGTLIQYSWLAKARKRYTIQVPICDHAVVFPLDS